MSNGKLRSRYGNRGPVVELLPTLPWGGGRPVELIHVDAGLEAFEGCETVVLRLCDKESGVPGKDVVGHDGLQLWSDHCAAVASWVITRYDGGAMALASASATSRYLTADGISPSLAEEVNDDVPLFTLRMRFPPIVDVSPLLVASENGEDDDATMMAAQGMFDACHDVGCFFMSGHGLRPKGLLQPIQRAFVPAVSSSPPAKHVATDDDTHTFGRRFQKVTLRSTTGRVKTSFNPPRHDTIVLPGWLETAIQEDGGQSADSASSGEAPAALVDYYTQAERVGRILLERLADKSFDPAVELYNLFRCVLYPSSEASTSSAVSTIDGALPPQSLEMHSDKSWITLLAATEFHGLQFLDVDGVTFFDIKHPGADPEEECEEKVGDDCLLLVNVGDALQMHSNGAFVSRPHQATNRRGDMPRVSLPLFVEPEPDHWPKPYVTDRVRMMEL